MIITCASSWRWPSFCPTLCLSFLCFLPLSHIFLSFTMSLSLSVSLTYSHPPSLPGWPLPLPDASFPPSQGGLSLHLSLPPSVHQADLLPIKPVTVVYYANISRDYSWGTASPAVTDKRRDIWSDKRRLMIGRMMEGNRRNTADRSKANYEGDALNFWGKFT